MMRKRSYTAVDVEHFDLSAVLPLVTVGRIVAIDVAKTKFVAAVATSTGEVVKLVRFEHPRQTPAFLRMLEGLRDAGRTPSIVMEPTGTYGDAVRYRCVERGMPVHMMPPKHTHDFAEVLDGVPSMHDQAIKPARAWQPASEERRDLRAWVEQRTPIARTIALYHGHLEAMLARHWPEFGTLMDVHERRSWFALLQEFPGPHRIAIAGEAAMETLRKASRGNLGRERVQRIVDAAKTTVGVPMTAGEEEKLRTVTEQIELHTRRMDRVDARLEELVQSDEVLSRMGAVVGPACAASIGSLIGSPLDFTSARALEMATGLNLKERSSGNKEGRLSLTKRGPAQVRQLLYMAALRLVKDNPIVASWYRARGAYKAETKTKAVVAVMRKLARALWHVARGDAFDATKLFDMRRLDVAPLKTVRRSESSTPMRSEPREGGAAITQ